MQLSIILDEDDGPESVRKAVTAVGLFYGPEIMGRVAAEMAAGFRATASSTAIAAVTADEAPLPPANTVFAPPPPAGPVELDTEGLPWDARIHSSSKNKTQKGTWKFARNLDDAVKASVLAELRGKYPAPVTTPTPPATTPPAPPPPAGNAAEIPDFLRRAPEPPAAAPPPPAAAAPAPAPAAPAATGYTFVTLMQRITEGLNTGKLAKADVDAACKSAGLDSPAAAGNPANAHHIPTIGAYIDAVIMSR